MKLVDETIKEILLKTDYVLPEDIARAEEFVKRHGSSIAEYLINEQVLTRDLLGQAIAETFDIPYADLNSHPPTREQVRLLPETEARKLRIVVYKTDPKGMVVSTDAPEQSGLATKIAKIFSEAGMNDAAKRIKLAYSLPEDIDTAFLLYRQELDTRFGKILAADSRVAPELLDEIMRDAHTLHASDIHFEPREKDVVIRFRIDGLLQEAGKLPKEHYETLVNRVKVQARLRTDEHFAAQDGAIRLQHETSEGELSSDVRVSIVPTLDGEKIVMRLLTAYVRGLTLTDLGLSADDQKVLLEAAEKPFGMILAVGPTGSGKTTTLYSVLKTLNRPEVNIATIEDPVEYKMLGVNHIQVNSETNLTFAKGLRSIVRQDPDIILVGEIRDQETAEIAVNAALTGHLLLSTFHANDAATAIPRLLDMGVEPFLLASTLEIVMAQRLARRICEQCRYSRAVTVSDLPAVVRSFFSGKTVTLYRGKGCSACNGTGFKGRIALFEIITLSPDMQDLILKNPSTQQIAALARSEGAHSLFEDGIAKAKVGVTTIEEVLRVAAPPRLRQPATR